MPEGDILRRTANTLEKAMSGSVVVAAELRWPSAAGVDLVGRTIVSTQAYGKHLFTRFDDHRTLHTHLRMEGSWRLHPSMTAAVGRRRRDPRSERSTWGPFVRAVLSTADWTAVGERLGMLDVVPTRDEGQLIAHLGPDVLGADFPTTGLAKALERFSAQGARPVAEVLLDQTVLAGIGTIYMAESLFARSIWPWTAAREVLEPASLLMTARVLMERSVAAQSPTWSGDGGPWANRRVHGRHGKPCQRCGTPIAVGEAGAAPVQRPVFYCPVCQKAHQREA